MDRPESQWERERDAAAVKLDACGRGNIFEKTREREREVMLLYIGEGKGSE